jgi:hypothetical protein
MRARNIKPGFFDDENLAGLGPYAQLLFAGLWCLADRDGKLDDRPARIKAHIFPYYEPKPNVITLLDKLCHCNFIQRYTVGMTKYIKVLKFVEHQRPHPHEAASKIPDPENINESDVMACHDNAMTEPYNGSKCKSDSLIPDSLIPDSLITAAVTSGSGGGSQQENFDRFWSAYPKKMGKQEALKAWEKISPKNGLVEKMLSALEIQRKWPEWNKAGGQFIPRASTWLNGKRWEDEITVEGQSAEETYIDKKLKDIGYTGGPGHDDYARNAG